VSRWLAKGTNTWPETRTHDTCLTQYYLPLALVPDVLYLVTVRRTHIFTIYVWYMTYRYRHLTYDILLPVSDIWRIATRMTYDVSLPVWHMTYRYRYLTYDVSLPVYDIWRVVTGICHVTYRYPYDIWRIVTGNWHMTYCYRNLTYDVWLPLSDIWRIHSIIVSSITYVVRTFHI